MADWSKPTITSNYVTFVDEVKARDVDALTMQGNMPAPPLYALKMVRSPIRWDEWDGIQWVPQVLSIQGGGTNASSASGARTNLGLGTMAVQNSNAIAVTGGTIANINSSGTFAHVGGGTYFSPILGQTQHTVVMNGPNVAGYYGLYVIGSATPGASYGLVIDSGYNINDISFTVRNRNSASPAILVRGNMACLIQNRLVIPVGVDLWATP